jgi:hypothetical protein
MKINTNTKTKQRRIWEQKQIQKRNEVQEWLYETQNQSRLQIIQNQYQIIRFKLIWIENFLRILNSILCKFNVCGKNLICDFFFFSFFIYYLHKNQD